VIEIPGTLAGQGRAAPRDDTDETLRADAEALHRALGDLIRVYQFRDRDRICCHGLSVSQCYALESVVRSGGLGVNDLAGELFLDKSTVSRVVKGLEEKGLVGRRTHPEDGRAVILVATAQGERLYARIEGEILEQEAEILAEMSPEARRGLTRALRSLGRAAAARVDTSGGCCRSR
jgi:DNA-binding MarR family transcriptional regulator